MNRTEAIWPERPKAATSRLAHPGRGLSRLAGRVVARRACVVLAAMSRPWRDARGGGLGFFGAFALTALPGLGSGFLAPTAGTGRLVGPGIGHATAFVLLGSRALRLLDRAED